MSDTPEAMPLNQDIQDIAVLPSPTTHHHLALSRHARRDVRIELVLGLIGLYGVGSLLSGKMRIGVGALAFSAMWLGIRLILLAVTAGVALFVLLPLTIIFAISHALTLRRILRQDLH
jgi:hypothetical protein